MASDAHAHPYDLEQKDPGAEAERRALGIPCAASSWNYEEFQRHELLASGNAVADSVASGNAGANGPADRASAAFGAACPADRADRATAACSAEPNPAPLVLCFGVHPQLPASLGQETARRSLETLYELAEAKRIGAIGEAGYDLFDESFRATEALQEELFTLQAELALAKGLPLVLHLRRAMHKAFAHSRILARLPAIVIHSYPGTLREAEDLVKRGVNAYFSFGTTIQLNHKQAMAACAGIPGERLLFESDAPYQPLRGRPYSTHADLRLIIDQAAQLRVGSIGNQREKFSREELERAADENFRRVFLSASAVGN